MADSPSQGMTQPQRFRKKPVVIEALTFDVFVEYGRRECGPHLHNGMPWSFDFVTRFVDKEGREQVRRHPITHETDDCYLIPTLEGTMKFNRGERLITGVQGEIYPCKPDIFAATYEPESLHAPPPGPPQEDPELPKEVARQLSNVRWVLSPVLAYDTAAEAEKLLVRLEDAIRQSLGASRQQQQVAPEAVRAAFQRVEDQFGALTDGGDAMLEEEFDLVRAFLRETPVQEPSPKRRDPYAFRDFKHEVIEALDKMSRREELAVFQLREMTKEIADILGLAEQLPEETITSVRNLQWRFDHREQYPVTVSQHKE
jgi:hypothetical protein